MVGRSAAGRFTKRIFPPGAFATLGRDAESQPLTLKSGLTGEDISKIWRDCLRLRLEFGVRTVCT